MSKRIANKILNNMYRLDYKCSQVKCAMSKTGLSILN